MDTSIKQNPEYKQFDSLFETARGSIGHLVAEETLIRERMEQLEKNGLIFATAYWRSEKYLYLIYPMVNGQRKRQYIGASPDKVRTALDAIARGKLHADLARQLKEIEQSLKEARHCLDNVIWSESEARGEGRAASK